MSSSNYFRSWIDRPHLDPNTRLLTEEYQRGITEFMGLVHRQPEAKTGMLRCPCSNCKNRKVIKEWDVWTHLYLSGFTRSYKIWYHHGETDYEHGSTSEPQPAVRLEEPIRTDVDYGVESISLEYSDRIPRKFLKTSALGTTSSARALRFHDDQTRPRQRCGRGGTGSQSQDSPSPHSSYQTSPSAAPPPAPLAAASAPGPPGVMSVAELVRQPGRDHLPYLTPYPHGRGQTWFNRSGNGISACINRMMYSALDKGHPTFTDFPSEKQHMWFRQFAGLIPRNIPRESFLGIFRGLISSGIPDDCSEERFVGTSEDWTIGKSIGIFRGDFRRTGGPRSFL
uniref:Transposase-associated domain-containing protein n=1 Tax=Brassica oleracea var. oleracea TaxID=109376 RepID=A0A0D3DA10_BRAOL